MLPSFEHSGDQLLRLLLAECCTTTALWGKTISLMESHTTWKMVPFSVHWIYSFQNSSCPIQISETCDKIFIGVKCTLGQNLFLHTYAREHLLVFLWDTFMIFFLLIFLDSLFSLIIPPVAARRQCSKGSFFILFG